MFETMKRTAEKPASPGARLWSQTQPQHVGLFGRAAAGASHTAALRSSIPTGLHHSAQGCEGRATLGHRPTNCIYPEGVESNSRCKRGMMQPLQGCESSESEPRVARSSQPWAERFNPFGITPPSAPDNFIYPERVESNPS